MSFTKINEMTTSLSATATTRGIAVTVAGNVAPVLAALATQPLLALGLGVTGRGEVAAATAPLVLAVTILTLGIPESLTYHLARVTPASRILRTTFLILTAAGLLGSAGISILAEPLSAGNDPLARLMIIASLALVPTLIVAALRGIAASHLRWRRIALERAVGAFVRLAAVAVLFVSGHLTAMSATIAIAVTACIGGLVYLLPAKPTPAAEETRPPPVGTRTVLAYGGRIWLGSLAGILLLRLDQVLITPLSTVEELGIYVVAVSIAEVVLVFNAAVRDVMFAVESREASVERVSAASRMSTIITLAIGLCIAGCAPWIIPIAFGVGFAPSVPVIYVLLLGVLVGNPGSVAGAALSARGRPGLRSASIALGLVVNLGAILLLVPSIGAMGAAVATLLGNAVAGNMNIVWLRKHFSFPASNFYRFRVDDLRSIYRATSAVARRGSR